MTSHPQIQENIAKMKVIVYKSMIDHATLKQKAEEMKNELFIKRFSKPKPEDIHVVSVDKHYEPYILIDAKYRIEYYTKKVYTIEVAEKASAIKIFGTTIKPQTVPIPESRQEQTHKVINIEGEEWSFYENKIYLILDKNGNEISPDQIPVAASEDSPKRILKEFRKNTKKATISSQEAISRAKSRLIKRPQDIDNIEKELFQVTECATIYNPIYKITFRNMKNEEEKTVHIDGVTAEIIE